MKMSQEELAYVSKQLDDALKLPAELRIAWADRLQTSDRVKSVIRDLLAKSLHAETNDLLGTLPKLLETSNGDSIESSPQVSEDDLVGPYRLLRELGRGGMGAVWLAERSDGLIKRPVALKLPHLGRHNPALVERFNRERDILASLTHPHIARLYDVGFAGNGQPFLALEYIENGVPITTYCDQQRLPIHARLKLFLQILGAMEYAHSRSIIHRDLKPSNVLATTDGQVRLLDFGIAKLMDEDETSETELTHWGGRALTPTYASPEQIAGRPLNPASDVYSLGVILYELLVGARPYELKRDSWIALEKAVLSANLAPPSRRVKDPAAALARDVTVQKWDRMLKGDLDTIMLKALKKEPNERYATVKDFAQDLERHLSGQPVRARPDSVWYRTIKFISRKKLEVSAATAVVAALGIGFMYAYWLYRFAPTPVYVLPLERSGRNAVSDAIGDNRQAANPAPTGFQSGQATGSPAKAPPEKTPIQSTQNSSPALLASAYKPAAGAEPIRIGQCVEFSGKATAKENSLGARANFDDVNKRGDIHGEKIELLSLDDGRNKEKTIGDTGKLNFLALFGYRSTPIVEAIIYSTSDEIRNSPGCAVQ